MWPLPLTVTHNILYSHILAKYITISASFITRYFPGVHGKSYRAGRVCQSPGFNPKTAGRIFMKFGMNIMPETRNIFNFLQTEHDARIRKVEATLVPPTIESWNYSTW
jgi:hypothetical protein